GKPRSGNTRHAQLSSGFCRGTVGKAATLARSGRAISELREWRLQETLRRILLAQWLVARRLCSVRMPAESAPAEKLDGVAKGTAAPRSGRDRKSKARMRARDGNHSSYSI